MKMRITVIGTGYEGLTISVSMAALGHSVTAFDIDSSRTRLLQRGLTTIKDDPVLSDELKMAVREGQLQFTSVPESTLAEADVVIIANLGCSDKAETADRRAILRTAECLSGAIASFSTVLVTCAVPTGSCRLLQNWLDVALPTGNVDVVANPVFFRQPNGFHDFLHPERIILGYENERPRRVLDEIFANLLLSDPQVFHVSWEAAEMMRFVQPGIASDVPDSVYHQAIPQMAVSQSRKDL